MPRLHFDSILLLSYQNAGQVDQLVLCLPAGREKIVKSVLSLYCNIYFWEKKEKPMPKENLACCLLG